MRKAILATLTALAVMTSVPVSSYARGKRPAKPQTKLTQVSDKITRVTVSGDATVNAQPDTAILVFSVVTQNAVAVEAQQENARLSNRVLDALKRAAGNGAEVKTSGYSLNPQRVYKEGQPPTITGYEARNSVTVTMGNLDQVGAVIDAAGKAGANNVDGISFTLRADKSVRDQALTNATTEAMSKAQTIAKALGGRLVRIAEVQEAGAQQRPIIYAETTSLKRDDYATPIEVGNLEMKSQVTVVAEIAIG
ncbi:MAG: SIMPL domain-containing protein [Pyrinomonadaceae bacterium]